MARHRSIAASPVRTAAETWDVISTLVVDTLDKSPVLAGTVAGVMRDLTPAGLALVASGYLGSNPLTLVAEPLYLTITTTEGAAAISGVEEENLNPVPGGTTATDWMIYLPTPAGLAGLVQDVVSVSVHASAAAPPAEPDTKEATSSGVGFDLRRLDPRNRN